MKKYEAVTGVKLRALLGAQCSPMGELKGYVIGPDINGRVCHCGTYSSLGEAQRAADRLNYQPETGQPCHCKRGQQRDNCPDCEGTGMRIDFAAIRARRA